MGLGETDFEKVKGLLEGMNCEGWLLNERSHCWGMSLEKLVHERPSMRLVSFVDELTVFVGVL